MCLLCEKDKSSEPTPFSTHLVYLHLIFLRVKDNLEALRIQNCPGGLEGKERVFKEFSFF